MLKGPTRPSLGWYANRKMLDETDQVLGNHWVVSNKPPKGCEANGLQLRATSGEEPWQLWFCPVSPESLEADHEGQ